MYCVILDPVGAGPTVERRWDAPRLVAGLVGRVILSLVASALVVTLLPMLLGWHSYVVVSGSMEPRIGAGDVVIAAPTDDLALLRGRVAAFADPSRPGTVKTHRVVGTNPDGTLQTKGDANPTRDSAELPVRDVIGLGRLLVPHAGQPMLWLHTGQWPMLAGFLLLVGGSVWAVARDHEPEPPEAPDGPDAPDGPEGRPTPARRLTGRGRLGRWRALGRLGRRGPRIVLVGVGAAALVLPTTAAAFSGRTTSPADSWTMSGQHYTAAVSALTPYLSWSLNDTGATAADSSGNGRTGTYAGSVTTGVPGGTPDDTTNVGVALTGATSCVNTTSLTAVTAPAVLTEVVWFKAAVGYNRGGKLIGFENPRTGIGIAGVTSIYDRMLYLDGAGKVWFGVYNNGLLGLLGYVGVSSPSTYADGAWHMAAASLGPAGMALYVDGALVATDPNTVGQSTTGYWRVGCGNLAGWGGHWTGPNNPDQNLINLGYNAPFTGSLDEASVYAGTALTPTQIAQLYFAR